MSAHIEMNRQRLLYQDGKHTLVLPVSWSYAPTSDASQADVEINTEGVTTWTEPQGEPIPRATWEKILDEIAARYPSAPGADILGKDGALLRGVSTYRFNLQAYPSPSRYYEKGRFLAIPMVQTDKTARPRLVLDVSEITSWTEPAGLPLPRSKLDEILVRILKEKPNVGVLG